MPRKSAGLQAETIEQAKTGRYGDGSGLYLLVRSAKTRSWVFRYTMPGAKMREMGLGRAGNGASDVTLAEARERAAALLKLVRSGTDPLADRNLADAQAGRSIAGSSQVRSRRHTCGNITPSRSQSVKRTLPDENEVSTAGPEKSDCRNASETSNDQDSLAALRLAMVESLANLAEKTQNPLYIWEAVYRCLGLGIPLPDCCVRYLLYTASKLYSLRREACGNDENPPSRLLMAPERVAHAAIAALQLTRPGWNAFKMYAADQRRMQDAITQLFEDQVVRPSANLTSASEKIAARRGRDAEHKQRLVQRQIKEGLSLLRRI
jgi:hypothetical protein